MANNVKSLILTSNGLITGYIVEKSVEECYRLFAKTGYKAGVDYIIDKFLYIEDVEINAYGKVVELPYLFLSYDEIKGISVVPESKSAFIT